MNKYQVYRSTFGDKQKQKLFEHCIHVPHIVPQPPLPPSLNNVLHHIASIKPPFFFLNSW